MRCCRWDYVSWFTKAAILSELNDRITASEFDVYRMVYSEDEARQVVNSPVFNCVVEMLRSLDTRVRSSACRLLGSLASHECAAPAILELKPCVWLVSLQR
jgi:hypothetical protein